MNRVGVCYGQHRRLSSQSITWISPLRLSESRSCREADPPPAESATECRRRPKYVSHENAIALIKREKDPQLALEIFNSASEQKGFSHNSATYSAILHRLASSKKFKAVDAVLRQMTYETCKFHEALFLNLMSHFSRSSLHERVIEMFFAIGSVGRGKPSVRAVSTCLNLLVEAGRVDLARKLLVHANRSLGLRPNTCIFNVLVKHHCKSGDLGSAFEVVEEMKKARVSYPNLITYSTLIHGLCENGRLREAIQLFEEMISKDQITPDALTYNVLIHEFCRGGNVDKARKIMEFMKRNGCEPNVFNYSALINGLCKAGMLQEADDAFGEMKSVGVRPDKVVYTTLIGGFCGGGRVDDALGLLKEMKESGCRADVVTFNVVLGGLCREGRFDEAIEMLEKLPLEGMRLNKASHRIVLNLLCGVGELRRAVDLLDLMLGRGFVPHFATSNELLVRLCDAGMVDDAVVALFGLINAGFRPDPDSWGLLVESISRERKLLYVFQLLDELVT